MRAVRPDQCQIAVDKRLDHFADSFLAFTLIDPYQFVFGMKMSWHGEVLACESTNVEKTIRTDQYVLSDHRIGWFASQI